MSLPGAAGSGSATGAGGAGNRQSVTAILKASKSELQEHKQLLVATVMVGLLFY
jgi:hypothetical protein